MAHSQRTWGLTEDWDLAFDENGNVKTLSELDAILQNVANEIRLFRHDAYFRWEDGIQWFEDQLGKPLQVSVVTARLRAAAQSVDGVMSVGAVTFDGVDKDARTLHGTIEIETEYGHGRAGI